MKKALLYELKRNLLPLVIFTVIVVVVSVSYSAMAELEREFFDGKLEPRDPCLGCYTAILCILCTVVPVLQFSYRMKQRSVDLWYSLPVTRKQLTLVRILGGLLLTLVPFALGYWLGVSTVAIRGAHFRYLYYLPNFALLLLWGSCLFGVNAFLFTRGNSVFDGIVFVAAWACMLPIAWSLLNCAGIAFSIPWRNGRVWSTGFEGYLFTYSPVVSCTNAFANMVRGGSTILPFGFSLTAVLGLAEGGAAYFGLMFAADRDRAEDAGQASSSRMGYKVLIPVYAAISVATILLNTNWKYFDGSLFFSLFLTAACSFVAYFIYRRTFRIKKCDILSAVIALAAGALLALLLGGVGWLIDEASGESAAHALCVLGSLFG